MLDVARESSACLSCGKTDKELPLVLLRYSSREIQICPQCLPILIHHPDRLAETLKGQAEKR